MMAEENGLGPLQMSISGHDNIAVFFRRRQERLLKTDEKFSKSGNFLTDVQMCIQGDLVIPGTSRMKTLAGFTDGFGKALFNIHMNILQRRGKFKITGFNLPVNFFQSVHNGILVVRGNNTFSGKHRRMDDAAANIFGIHSAVVLNGSVKFFYRFIRRLCKSTAPQFHRKTPLATGPEADCSLRPIFSTGTVSLLLLRVPHHHGFHF